jgi:hypothetical protein
MHRYPNPDVALILEFIGETCREVADSEFRNVLRLMEDDRSGRFVPARSPDPQRRR